MPSFERKVKNLGVSFSTVLFVTEKSLDEHAFKAAAHVWSITVVPLPEVNAKRVEGVSWHLKDVKQPLRGSTAGAVEESLGTLGFGVVFAFAHLCFCLLEDGACGGQGAVPGGGSLCGPRRIRASDVPNGSSSQVAPFLCRHQSSISGGLAFWCCLFLDVLLLLLFVSFRVVCFYSKWIACLGSSTVL